MPDRVNPGFGVALNSLRVLWLILEPSIFADVSLYANAPMGGGFTYTLNLLRNTASLIQQITKTCNGVQLRNINDYNILFNTLYDIEGADISQTLKRFFENADPSVGKTRN